MRQPATLRLETRQTNALAHCSRLDGRADGGVTRHAATLGARLSRVLLLRLLLKSVEYDDDVALLLSAAPVLSWDRV